MWRRRQKSICSEEHFSVATSLLLVRVQEWGDPGSVSVLVLGWIVLFICGRKRKIEGFHCVKLFTDRKLSRSSQRDSLVKWWFAFLPVALLETEGKN